jgi:single-strand DNA-binding protein
MAINGTTVTLVGNCTRDPELRYTNSGMAVASFGVAVNFRKMNRQSNDWEEEDPTFYDVSCFTQLAENVCDTVHKGTRVVVVGRLRSRSWEGRDGEKRSTLEVVADEIAPSLRFASAEVKRNERRDDFGGGGGGGGGGDDRGSRPAPGPVGTNPDYDEEPF